MILEFIPPRLALNAALTCLIKTQKLSDHIITLIYYHHILPQKENNQ